MQCAVCPIIDVGNPRAVLSSHSSLEQHHHHDLGGEHDDDHDDKTGSGNVLHQVGIKGRHQKYETVFVSLSERGGGEGLAKSKIS